MIKHHHSNKTIPADIVRRHPFANPLAEGGGCATMHKTRMSKMSKKKQMEEQVLWLTELNRLFNNDLCRVCNAWVTHRYHPTGIINIVGDKTPISWWNVDPLMYNPHEADLHRRGMAFLQYQQDN